MWIVEPTRKNLIRLPNLVSTLKLSFQERVLPSFWSEHCTECSVPDCYSSCPLYSRKGDGSCRRFEAGIEIIKDSVDGVGIRIVFKKWGKLETALHQSPILIPFYKSFSILFYLSQVVCMLYNPKHRTQERIARYSERFLNAKNAKLPLPRREVVSLLIEAKTNSSNSWFVVELADGSQILDSRRVKLEKELSKQKVSLSYVRKPTSNYNFRLYPVAEARTEVFFKNLEIVNHDNIERESSLDRIRSDFIKCVAWDLDNTLWDGIVGEDSEKIFALRAGKLEVLKELDSRGILNVIISKNDYDVAMNKIQELGIEDLFVSFAINWNTKSSNIKQIAEHLNLSLDSFLFVDDSDFERREVVSQFPEVDTVPDLDSEQCNSWERLKPPQSSETATRRKLYQENSLRLKERSDFSDSYEQFLRESRLNLLVRCINSSIDAERAYELLSRTNQLNISGRRYEWNEFLRLLSERDCIWLVGSVEDKYGSYGTVLVARITQRSTRDIVLKDLAISCRVAEKFVESSFVHLITSKFASKSGAHVYVDYRETAKNGPMRAALDAMGFMFDNQRVVLLNNEDLKNSDIVKAVFLED